MKHAWLQSGVFVLALAVAGSAAADDAAVYYNQGLILKRQGKTAEAIAEMKKAIAARKDYAAAWFSLGNLYRGRGRLQQRRAGLPEGHHAAAQGCR